MLSWLRRRGEAARKAEEIYGVVVAQARRPHFYAGYGVPDTLRGRYEMLALSLFLLLERMRRDAEAGAALQDLSRLTLERFCTDMDDCMREIGIGDLSVPKKVKRAAIGFYERAALYREAIDAQAVERLSEHLSHFFKESGEVEQTGRRLAAYAMLAQSRLAQADLAEVLDGRAFPDPGDVPELTIPAQRSKQGPAQGDRA